MHDEKERGSRMSEEEMSTGVYTSPCPFCGQYDFAIDFTGCTSREEAETIAIAACSYPQAEQERELRVKISAARSSVAAMCSPEAAAGDNDRKINAEATELICALAELAVRHRIVSASVAATRYTKITIRATADEVKLCREDREKEVETV